jgi:polyisoprenoid-binding protein YceI
MPMTAPTTTPDLDQLLATQPLWHLDPWHTAVHFALLNRGAGRVRGRFAHVAGTLEPGPDGLADTRVHVSIETASFTTAVRMRDNHVRGAGFLDTDNHPTATFEAAGFTRTGITHGRLDGTLALRGITKGVSLAVRWEGSAPDPFQDGATHLAFTATGHLTLSDFGMGQELLPGLRIPGLGDTIELVLDVVLISYDPQPMLASISID